RTLWPARSPKAMHCCTEAARVRASSGALSSRGSYPVATAASTPVSRYPKLAELTDDPVTDLLEDCGDVRIAGRLAREKAGLEAVVGAIEVDPLEEDAMKMEVEIEGTPKALDKRHRPRVDCRP